MDKPWSPQSSQPFAGAAQPGPRLTRNVLGCLVNCPPAARQDPRRGENFHLNPRLDLASCPLGNGVFSSPLPFGNLHEN